MPAATTTSFCRDVQTGKQRAFMLTGAGRGAGGDRKDGGGGGAVAAAARLLRGDGQDG